MKILVTGASGFLGRHVLASLHLLGHQVVVLGRTLPTGFEESEHIALDLLQSHNLALAMQQANASHLLHLAWYTEHGKYWTSSVNFDWVQATLRLVEAFCKHGGKRVVIAGTCAEYDWSSGYLREHDSPCNPATTYGIAKNATRQLTQALCDLYGTSFAWGRVFFPYGPGEDSQRLIPSLFKVFKGAASPFGVNASAYRDMLHVSDVAKAFVALLVDNVYGSINVSSGQPVQIEYIVRLVADLCNADAKPVLDLVTHRQGEPHLLVGENVKLSSMGWSPDWTLRNGLSDALGGLT